MFHVELRQFPHKAWRFNLSEAELRAVAIPWARKEWLEFGERKWNPHEAEITILEGPELAIQELSMGRGWRTALRRSEEITERVLTTIEQAEEERARNQENARIEQAARALTASPEATTTEQESPAHGALVADPLVLGVQLAALLGSQPSQLLAAWQQAAAASPELSPSETLALAEQALAGPIGNPG
jgi:hypothetical protein